jgi:hypothetical protein
MIFNINRKRRKKKLPMRLLAEMLRFRGMMNLRVLSLQLLRPHSLWITMMSMMTFFSWDDDFVREATPTPRIPTHSEPTQPSTITATASSTSETENPFIDE